MNSDKSPIEILLQRKKGVKDDRKIGLMLPGGGMSGVFGGGVVQVLERLGLADKFDYIYGFSSGTCSGAYLLSERTKQGTSIYWENLCGTKFIRPWKLSKSMQMDYFCDEVVRKVKKLDIDKIKNSRTILKLYVTEVKTGNCTFFTNKDDVDIISVMKASCTYPGFSTPVEIRGKEYFDGNAIDLIPVKLAVEDGCTDLFIVPTVPEAYRAPGFGIVYFASKILGRKYSKRFRDRYKAQISNFNYGLDVAFGRKKLKDKINIYTISPDYYLSPAETSSRKLRAYEGHGVSKAERAFGLR